MTDKNVAGRRAKKATVKDREGRERKKGLHVGFLFLVLLFLAGTGVFMLVQHQCAVRCDLKCRQLESKISDEKTKQESLRLRLASLKSPGRVARIATDQIGLSDPSGVIYLKYSRDTSGNMMCQSTYEELAARRAPPKDEEESVEQGDEAPANEQPGDESGEQDGDQPVSEDEGVVEGTGSEKPHAGR